MNEFAAENAYDVIVIGTGPIGQIAAGRARGGAERGGSGTETGRRGVFVLGVHPQQGDAAPGGRDLADPADMPCTPEEG